MRFISGRLVFGLAILVLGVLVLLSNLGVGVDVGRVWSYWPVIPLVLGLNWLVLSFRATTIEQEKRVFFSWGQFISALIIVAIGVVYLGRNLNIAVFEAFDTRLFWSFLLAVILIMIGLSLIKGRSAAAAGGGSRFTFMGGCNVGGATPWKLESGSYFAFMGGIDLDLTAAEIGEGETVLDLTAVMGGIDVIIPRGLAVIYEGSAILGGITFRDLEDAGIVGGRKIEHNITEATERLLRIQARAVMGGIEIKER